MIAIFSGDTAPRARHHRRVPRPGPRADDGPAGLRRSAAGGRRAAHGALAARLTRPHDPVVVGSNRGGVARALEDLLERLVLRVLLVDRVGLRERDAVEPDGDVWKASVGRVVVEQQALVASLLIVGDVEEPGGVRRGSPMAEQVAGRERVVEDDPAIGDLSPLPRRGRASSRSRASAPSCRCRRRGRLYDPRRQVLDAGVAVDAEVLERHTDREQDDRGGDVRERDHAAAPG